MTRSAVALSFALMLAAAFQDEMEDNPEYKSWAKQKPGAWVKWNVETHTGAMTLSTELTWTLKELAADKAVIEEKTVLKIGDETPREQVSTRPVPAKVKKGMTSEGARVEVVKEGEEELVIKGRKMKCRWVEQRMSGRQGGSMKIWKSDEIVGGAAKVETKHDEAAKMTMTMTVVDWKAGD